MKIGTIVLNYNGWKDTLECIESLKRSQKYLKGIEIIVVDNNSTDESLSHLPKIKGISLIRNKENLGYSGGNNIGIKYALKNQCDFILIINNDTYVDELFFKNLFISQQIDDIVSPKIYFAPGFEFHKERYSKNELGKVIWYAGGKIDWKNILGVHIGVDEVDSGQFDKINKTDFATGACMIIKSEVFEKVGYFDERYFLYLEDMDFCVRAKKEGLGISFMPKAVIWHKNASSSGGSGSRLQDYYITRNRLLFAFKFAKLKAKLAVLKQTTLQAGSSVKRHALIDFLTFKFGKRERTF
jgi:hypothetical protein